ncbi:BTAD domain-containing putative transcriptional regulator [Saccharothrix sp. HUAS TT1]|uniref:BTAD domain-containing putative transcriptional regulator n=1 Tax=unclassified Saccharothrix TaxID=2593673 RepID=UPI00345C3845
MREAEQPARFARALRRRRREAGLTQAELAAASGISVRTVRAVEQGRPARPGSLAKLAAAVGLDWPPAGPRVDVLGPLVVRTEDGVPRWESRKPRVLLALLAVHPGQVVGHGEIVDVLWDGDPPAAHRNLVHGYVARLRTALGDASVVRSERGGYRSDLPADRLDLARFDALAARSDLAALGEALDLWRGPVLADLPELHSHPTVRAITARRATAAIALADLALEAGTPGTAVEHLRRLVADEPLHEGLHARLLTALAADGRQAAALEEFARVRARLVGELGVEPGPELRAAHVGVLRQDLPDDPVVELPTPAQLPVGVSHFTGRDDELARLDALLDEHAGAVLITAIAGAAGVGKTALALHWANRVRHRFPDGQLHLDLRGFAAHEPMRPVEALGRVLRAFGVRPELVPSDVDEAAAVYRSVLAARRVLVVLDNAADADQVRPLLPSSPGSTALITSRDRLGGVVAHDGAVRLALDVLAEEDSVVLLERTLGADRVAAEPNAARQLAELCAHLPLALRVVAANLADQPHRLIADQVEALREGNRLTQLTIDGAREAAVRTAFELSYRRLPEARRRLFRVLGAVPGSTFTADAAAALLEADRRQAEQGLRALLSLHLVQERSAGRYGFHDLLRLYARELAESEADAAGRLHAWYLDHADGAARLLYPDMLRLPGAPAERPPFDDAGAALAWLDEEIANIAAAVGDRRFPASRGTVLSLADAVRGYFRLSSRTGLWQSTAEAAVAAATEGDDPRAAAAAHLSLSGAHLKRSDLEAVAEHASAALSLAGEAGWTAGEAAAAGTLASVVFNLGRLTEAKALFEETLRFGAERVTATSLVNLGNVALLAGDPVEAGRRYGQAAALCREIGSPYIEAMARGSMAELARMGRRFEEAREHVLAALAFFRQVQDEASVGRGLATLAEVERDSGDLDGALATAEAALEITRRSGDRLAEMDALNTLGVIAGLKGDPARSQECHRQALTLARRTGVRYPEINALLGLGDPESVRTARDLARAGGFAQESSSGPPD